MSGNGRRATSAPGRGSRASPIPSIPKSSSAPSTRSFAGARGPRGRGPCAIRSATGITPSAARSSAASGAPAMPNLARTRVSRPVERVQNPSMLAEVAAGLAAPQKELSPKYFYDQRGSELFEAITRLPEYYPTRTERALLEGWMPELMAQLGTRTLIELGAGNAEKSRIILDAMRATGLAELYVPIDVSATFRSETASQLRREYPGLTVEPAIADISVELNLPRRMPRPALFAFLGSTIGNFYPPAAIRLLARVRAAMGPGDRFLMGVDLRKDIARIEAAYNDSQGVTAEFNRNMLLVLNHELGADFDPRTFEHRAV